MPLSRIVRLWTPLAASWLLMAVELPLIAAVVARMADAEIHLAAYSSVVFPISLVIEGPIIMLLAAGTALSTDGRSYRQVHRFMMVAGALLTAVHVLVAFTPLFDLVASRVMNARAEILEPARLGLRLMTPWTWSIAYRRFHQGVLIRHEQSRAVGIGTLVRLAANATVLLAGAASGRLSGIVVAASAVVAGVLAEAAYVSGRVRPVLREHVFSAPARGAPLTVPAFLRFYVPLALTPLITLLIQPIGAASMNRMPRDLASVAAWPAVYGLLFMTRSLGMSYNEVVVTLAGEPGSLPALRRFNRRLVGATVGFLVLLAATPLWSFWFGTMTGLTPELAELCRAGVAVAVLMPGYAVMQSFYQGVLVKTGRTRPVTEAVVLYFAVSAALLAVGVSTARVAGLPWALGSFVVAGLVQTVWLATRARPSLAALEGAAGSSEGSRPGSATAAPEPVRPRAASEMR